VEMDRGEPVAATTVSPKPMETRTLGISTATVSHVVSPAGFEGRRSVVERLLRSVVHRARLDRTELLILRVDSDDIETLSAAQAAGFLVVEATATWFGDSHARATAPPLSDGLTVEVHEGDMADAISSAEVDQLTAHTSRWQLNHFYADLRIPRRAVERFYGEWVHNISIGAWSDCLFVVRHRDRLVGIASELSDRDLLEHTGANLRVMEWLLVIEPGLGAGRALMAAAGHHRHPGGRFHSWETQIRNKSTIRCIEQSEVARPVRSAYTLHAWPTSF
jgi:hypothetical protein